MTRLPIPGSDDGTWGGILNNFLEVSLNSDGTLKDAGTIASAVQTVNGKAGPTVALAESDIPNLTTDLSGKAATATQIATSGSLTGGGDLSASRTLSLVNDSAAPGNSVYYGTNVSGSKGYFALPLSALTPTFSYTGTIGVYSGDFRWYNDTGVALNITSVRVSLGTAPTGSSAIFDVLSNGSTIFTTTANRPTIAAGANTGLSGTPDTTAVASGDYLTVSIAQIGSTTPGADLTLTVVLQ